MKLSILDLGCGINKYKGAIGVDWVKRDGVDVVHNLNTLPYPFSDNTFDLIVMDNSLEHLDDVVGVMEEVHRISKIGSEVRIMVPYFRSRWAFIDPTHKHFFTVDSFAYFDPTSVIHERFGLSDVKFEVISVAFNIGLGGSIVRRLVSKFANSQVGIYERWISIFYPLDELTFVLKPI